MTKLAGTQAVAVPQPGPLAVLTPVPPRFERERVGEVADVATSDPDTKRDGGHAYETWMPPGARSLGALSLGEGRPGAID